MEIKQNSFMFYDNFLEAIEQLPESERANACYQLCRYALNDELPEDKSLAMFCIGVRYSVHKYQGRGGTRTGAGRPKKTDEEEKQKNQKNQKNQNTQTETETETETKKESIEKKDQKPVRGAFVPPTLEEVLEYARQMNDMRGVGGFMCSRQTATAFYEHYKSQGWMLGNGIHMTDWKPRLARWAAKEEQKLLEQ